MAVGRCADSQASFLKSLLINQPLQLFSHVYGFFSHTHPSVALFLLLKYPELCRDSYI